MLADPWQGRAVRDAAEGAVARAHIAQHQKGRGAPVPALSLVGAMGALADGVQVQAFQKGFHLLVRLA